MVPVRARGQLDQLRAEQFLGLARQDLGRVPVVLHDAPVVVDPEDQRPHGRGQGRMRGFRGVGDPGLLDVAGTGFLGVG